MSFTSHHVLAAVANEHGADLRRDADAARLFRAVRAGQPRRTWPASVISAAERLRAGLRLALTPPATPLARGGLGVEPRKAAGPAECCA